MDVEHGHGNWDVGNTGLAGSPRAGTADQRNVSGGTSHVEGDNVFKASKLGHAMRTNDSACGAGKHGAHWFAGGELARDDAARRLHYVEGAPMLVLNCGFEPLQISADLGCQIRIDHDGCGTFIFAEFGQNFVGDRDGRIGCVAASGAGLGRTGGGARPHVFISFPQRYNDSTFILRICEREQERNGDALGAAGSDVLAKFIKLLLAR